jgi:electron transport complex protein RnfB
MDLACYKPLAERLDALPEGFPPTGDGTELRLLGMLFTPEEAALAAQLRRTDETPAQIAARTGGNLDAVTALLEGMARDGLIYRSHVDETVRYRLMPFVVGIFESQSRRVADPELAKLVDSYFVEGLDPAMVIEPQHHRVIPVNQSVPVDIEIQPYESVAGIVDQAQAWGVTGCVCRRYKALAGEPCEHPRDVCLVLAQTPGAFDGSPVIRALTRDEALATLRRAAEAGLVHTLSNFQQGLGYICSCCTCACGVLRGVRELGRSNVVARSPFVSQPDAERCTGCETCLEHCQFGALSLADGTAHVDPWRCVGCGLCVLNCPDGALSLSRRPADEIKRVPATRLDWAVERAAARGLNLDEVLMRFDDQLG